MFSIKLRTLLRTMAQDTFLPIVCKFLGHQVSHRFEGMNDDAFWYCRRCMRYTKEPNNCPKESRTKLEQAAIDLMKGPR